MYFIPYKELHPIDILNAFEENMSTVTLNITDSNLLILYVLMNGMFTRLMMVSGQWTIGHANKVLSEANKVMRWLLGDDNVSKHCSGLLVKPLRLFS